MGCKCWALSPIKMKNLTYIIEIELVKHQSVWALNCPSLPQCWCWPLLCFWTSFTTICWDSLWHEFVQVVWCITNAVSSYVQPFVMSGKHWLGEVIHPCSNLSTLSLMKIGEPWEEEMLIQRCHLGLSPSSFLFSLLIHCGSLLIRWRQKDVPI